MYRLYGVNDWGSQVVHLALHVAGAAHDYHQCDHEGGELRSAAFLALNPFGRVPVLQTENGAIYETAAILTYLSEMHPGLAPAPGEADRGAFLTLFALVTNSLHPQAMTMIHPERPGGEAVAGAVARENLTALYRHLAHFEAAAAKAPWWLSGSRPSILSLYVAMLLRWVQNFAADAAQNIDLADYPALKAMAEGLERHPAVLRALAIEGLSGAVFSDRA